MDQFCSAGAHGFESLSSKKLLFLRPHYLGSKLFCRHEHFVINAVNHRASLESPLPLTSQPGCLFPRLDGVDPDDFVPKPLKGPQAHERGLAISDFTKEEYPHPIYE